MKKLSFFFILLFLCSLISFLQAQTHRDNTVDGNIYLKFHDFTEVSQDEMGKFHFEGIPRLDEIFAKYDLRKAYNSFAGTKSELLMKTFRIVIDNPKKVDAFIEELAALNQYVEYAEPVPLFKIDYTPDDLGPQSGSGNQWGLYQIKSELAWDVSLGDQTVLVAIVDDAVDIDHEDLSGVTWTNPGEIPGNGIDDDGNGKIDDVNGYDVANNDNDPRPDNPQMRHGTHVAGISGATTDNNTGISSIGAGITILPVKATYTNGAITDGYEGITYAAGNGAHVINCSWGGSSGGTTGQNVVNNAYNLGSILVIASGNNNSSANFYPAAYNNVISVASTTTGDVKSSFSNYGTTVDISAPGSSIFSTIPNDAYTNLSGTSMASPMVAGLVGLIYSVDPTLSRSDVEGCLLSTADDIDPINPSYAGMLGSGRINAEQALLCAQGLSNPLADDVGVQLITAPNMNYTSCSPLPVTVTATIRNFGFNTQSNTQVNYELDSAGTILTTVTENLTQSLAQGNTFSYTFAQQLILPGPGVFTLRVYTSLPSDGNSANDGKLRTITVSGSQSVFVENFESGSFNTNGWTTNNPDNTNGWAINSVSGASSGSQAAEMDMFFYTTGERDQLISQTFDFSNDVDLEMFFEHAHRRRDQGFADSLIVRVSTNGGTTYPFTIFADAENGAGNFGTGAITQGVQFTPSSTSDWCFAGGLGATCFSLDLSPFDGQSNVNIMFETYSSSGNNLYLDNIEIKGGCTTSNAQLPQANFYANQTAICSGEQVSFTNSSSNATGYSWSFPGGTPATSTQANPIVTYAQPGIYQVQLTANNGSGADVETKNSYITVNQSSLASFNFNNVGNLQVNFTNQSTGATSQTWDFGDGNTSTAVSPSNTYSAVGTYTVCLISDNQNCPADTSCQSVVVTSVAQGPPPTAQMSQSTNALCQGTAVNFYDQSLNSPTSWQWTFQGGTPASSTLQNPGITYYTPGTYDVTLIATNANGSDTLAQSALITVSATPTANFNNTISGLIVIFNDLSTGGTSWAWDFGDGNSSSAQSPTHTYSTGGTYTVCLTVSNLGCPSQTICNSVVVAGAGGGNIPKVSYSMSTSNVCESGSVQFFDQSSNTPVAWQWAFQGGTPATSNAQNPTVSYNTQGTFDVSLIASNANGIDTVINQAVINVYNSPVAAFNYNANGLTVAFQDASGGATSWTWGFGDGSFSNSGSPTYTYAAAGTYQVCLTADNPACSDDLKCDSITVDSTSSSTGIESDVLNIHGLRVYPNPVREQLFIEIDAITDSYLEIKLIDFVGKLHHNYVNKDVRGDFKRAIDVSSLSSGAYILLINGIAHRIVVN